MICTFQWNFLLDIYFRLCIPGLYNGYRVFPEGKERPGCDADLSPPSNDVVIKE
jgi:hypothetical protein